MNTNIKPNAEKIIRQLGLIPLEGEGGMYAEVYRSSEFIDKTSLPQRYSSKRCFYSSIYYLITKDNFSRLHKIKSDEVYHFYYGDSVEMINLFQDGSYKMLILGQDIFCGEKMQHLVAADVCQGARLKNGGSFALLGTTVSPGFEFEDFTPASQQKEALLKKYSNIKVQLAEYF